jgi:hypothetical protein
LDTNGFFTADGLHKFRNETAGYISYLNREKDARQFSQPVVSVIQTDVYSKDLLKQNKSATRKFYSIFKKEMDHELKTLKDRSADKIKEKPSGYDTLKNICENYEHPRARKACKRIVASYKKESLKNFKEKNMLVKQEINDYKGVVNDFKHMMKNEIDEAKENELNPLRYRNGQVKINDIESVYGRLKNCSKPASNIDKIVEVAISNNPSIAKLKNKIDIYKQRIEENSLILKKETNKDTKKVLKGLISKDESKIQGKSKTLKNQIKKFTKVVKNKIKSKLTFQKQNKIF